MKIILLLTVPLLLLSNTLNSQNFNADAVTKFWEITEVLQNDGELSDSLWNSYYNLPAVKNYMKDNRSEENTMAHREYLELFFKPMLSDSLAGIVNNKKYENDDIFQNMRYLKENQAKLRKFTETITSTAYITSAIELAKRYLPKNHVSKDIDDLNIYIQPITYDAAVQDKNMYFGLSIVHDFDKFQKGTVAAHELHHVLRNNKEIKNSLSAKDSASLWVVSKINNEGSADLIDKVIVIEHEKDIFLGPLFNQILLSDIEPVIKKIDQALVKNSSEQEDFTTKSDFNEIIKYFSGHIPGFYMSNVIRRNGFETQLIEGCDNPFNIFYLYNEAAAKDKNKPLVFSTEAIAYLKTLELKAYNWPLKKP